MSTGAPTRRWQQATRELLYELRVEGDTPARQGCAVALGIFIGCSPFYGLHLPLCLVFAGLLGLNRLKTYIAAHISTPIILPFLLFGEIQTGRLLRGAPPLTINPLFLRDDLRFGHWRRGMHDLLIGSVVVGLALAAVFGLVAFLLVRRGRREPAIEAMIERTAHRYLGGGLLHTELVRGKLRYDPVYLALLEEGLLPATGEVLDVGCGRGIPFALLLTAAERAAAGNYPPHWPPPPQLDRLVLRGVEQRPRIAAVAQGALGDQASIVPADLRAVTADPLAGALVVDVLHYLAPRDQEQLLATLAEQIAPGGRLLLREADAGAGWRFQSVRLGERLSALLRGRWRQRFHYRTAEQWMAALADLGFSAARLGSGRPSGNTLIVADRCRALARAFG